jgi:hypothetical protein
MIFKRFGTSISLGLAVLTAGAHAEARIGDYSHGSTFIVGDTSGNSNYRASYSLTSQQSSIQHSGVELVRASAAKEYLRTDVTLFGTQRNLLYALADSVSQQRTLSVDPQYLKSGYVELRVAGNVVIQEGAVSCNVPPYTICNDHSWSQSIPIWKDERTFTIGPVPVTITSKISGTLSAAINARAGSRRLNTSADTPQTFRGDALAKLVVGAALKSTNTAGVGVPGYQTGVGGTFDLLSLTISPTAIGSQSADVTRTTLRFENTIPTTLQTMDGRLFAYVQLWPGYWERTLVQWDGFTLTNHDPANFEGSLVVR